MTCKPQVATLFFGHYSIYELGTRSHMKASLILNENDYLLKKKVRIALYNACPYGMAG